MGADAKIHFNVSDIIKRSKFNDKISIVTVNYEW